MNYMSDKIQALKSMYLQRQLDSGETITSLSRKFGIEEFIIREELYRQINHPLAHYNDYERVFDGNGAWMNSNAREYIQSKKQILKTA